MMSKAGQLRITWLVPDDKGGGMISVAEACCRQATKAGYEATLLLALPPTGHATEFGGFRVDDLGAAAPYHDVAVRLISWLKENPQDVLVLNGCEQADAAIPCVPAGIRIIYVVHDTADRYFAAALRHEAALDGIVAVSETVAGKFRGHLRDPSKLRVVHNGTVLPIGLDAVSKSQRADDLVFVGADQPMKGAYDVIRLWSALAEAGFDGRLHWFGELNDSFCVRIKRLPQAGRIVVYGRKPRRCIFETAAAAKVVLMLSRVEPFGMATVECMGSGCIPVAWDIETGTKEIVGHDDGIFAPLGDYAALARGVRRALNLHASRFSVSTARIRSRFSEEAMWRRYEAVLNDLAAHQPVHRPAGGQTPPPYRPPLRLYQLLPAGLRSAIGTAVGRSPRLGYMLRDFRGR